MMTTTNITPEEISNILDLSEEAKSCLSKIESYSFNIFWLKDATKNNELVTTVAHIFAKEKIFDDLPISNRKFLPFMQAI